MEEKMTVTERLVSSAAVGALRSALISENLTLSEAQCILIDDKVSPMIRDAVKQAMRRYVPNFLGSDV